VTLRDVFSVRARAIRRFERRTRGLYLNGHYPLVAHSGRVIGEARMWAGNYLFIYWVKLGEEL
jgi:hypothetical protein